MPMRKTLFPALFILLLMLSSPLAFAAETSAANAAPTASLADAANGLEAPATSADAAAGEADSASASFSCGSTELSQKEAQAVQDLLKDGLLGSQLSSGTPANTDRQMLDNNTLVMHDFDSNEAAKTEAPSQKIEPWEVSHLLNNYIKGSFSVGIDLEDSLRTGVCKDPEDKKCSVLGGNLQYRNSGDGIKIVKEEITSGIKNIFGRDANEGIMGLTKEENDALQARLLDTQLDDNSSQLKTAQRIQSQMIPNSIFTDFFESRMETNCRDQGCLISSYSFFDKYFNAWTSAELTVSNVGPMFWGATKKAFHWSARKVAWPWQAKLDELVDQWKYVFNNPDTFLGKSRILRYKAKIDKYGFNELDFSLNYKGAGQQYAPIIQTAQFEQWWNDISKAGGYLDTVTTVERKTALVQSVKDMRSIYRAIDYPSKVAQQEYNQIAARAGLGSSEEIAARINFGRAVAKTGNWIDDTIGPDVQYYASTHPIFKLNDKAIKDLGTGEFIMVSDDSRIPRTIFDKFANDGHFGNWTGEAAGKHNFVFETSGDNLVLYKFKPSQLVSEVEKGELEGAMVPGAKMFVKNDRGEYLKLSGANIEYIKQTVTGKAQIFSGQMVAAQEMTPYEFAWRLSNFRMYDLRIARPPVNSARILRGLRERNFVERSYWSALDKLMAQEEEFFKSYFSVKGGAKWTAYPFFYWGAKRGLNVEGLSMYQLPETWYELRFVLGQGKIYGDAYIDFFANEGSDQGDIFVKMLNYLPWKLVLNEVSDKFSPLKDFYNQMTGREMRNETENLAYYLSTQSECVNCGVTLSTEDLKTFSPNFSVGNGINSYILEDTLSEKAKEKGQTLIAFAHHTDLKGKMSDQEDAGEGINLVNAINDKKTCGDALKDLLLGIDFSSARTAALTLGTLEASTYFLFDWAGIFGTAAIQTLVTPKLQDCVDTEEGYYAHYFVPVKKEEDKTGGTSEVSTEKVGNMVDDLKNQFLGAFEGDSNSLTQDAVDQLKGDIEKFVSNAKEADLVQATLNTQGLSSGALTGKKLFYFWCGPNCQITPSKYKTRGQNVIESQDGNIGLVFDYANGVMSRKDADSNELVPVLTNADAVRMSMDNLQIPATEIPQRMTIVCTGDSNNAMFEIDAKGNAFVKDASILSCIQGGIEEQTGLPLSSDNLADAFGLVDAVVTSSHPSITPLNDKIIAEGTPRKLAQGSNAKIIIKANKRVELQGSIDEAPEVGELESIQLKNGTIVVKPDGCLLVWLRHHEQGILQQADASNLKANLTSIENPDTGCEEPAVDFEVEGNPDSDLAMQRVDAFNKSLEKMGPFQVFETATKRYVLYSGTPPECQQHLKIIDKETGETKDLTGTFMQTPTGFKFIDENGVEHTFDFSAPNGVPTLTYNNGAPETLRMAEGKNGSFYYDPDKGLWYAENAQLLPLLEAFKDKGMSTQVGPNGAVTSTAAGNVVTVNTGSGSGFDLLNLPSLPENPLLLALFLSAILAVMVFARFNAMARKGKREK
ncbi:MAG: hypothetical protein V1494_03035 [Candidatus Diapherotrites archaeon]